MPAMMRCLDHWATAALKYPSKRVANGCPSIQLEALPCSSGAQSSEKAVSHRLRVGRRENGAGRPRCWVDGSRPPSEGSPQSVSPTHFEEFLSRTPL
ncbi:hypothetical protein TNCV_1728141 [Trichonephila clavipes]|nr:hypothetical protein TNCV_1728141 [Trichonephila clavipes]